MIFDNDETTQSTNQLQNNDFNSTKYAEDVKKRESYKLALMAIQNISQNIIISPPTVIPETLLPADGNNIINNAVEGRRNLHYYLCSRNLERG